MKPRTKLFILLIFGFTLIILASCTPQPNCPPSSTYNVTKIADTNDGVCSIADCSLREAVLNANACPGPQLINLPVGGYTLTIDGDDEDLGETGDLDITDDLTIIGTLPPPSIHGGIERAFHIHSGVAAVFEHIWLVDGSAIYGGGMVNEGDTILTSFTCNYNSVAIPPEGMGDAMGGCIFNTGNLTVQTAQFLANTAGYGGAIYNLDNATALIEDTSFIGNEAEFNGGALWNGVDAEFTLNNSTLDMNEAGVDGGGVWNHGDFYGEDLVLEDNHAIDRGGAIYVWMDTYTEFTNSWLTNNSANWGGGLYNNNGMVHFYESGITNNTATGPVGGGIYNNGPIPGAGLLLKNVTVSANTASGGVGGGGIYNTGNFDLRFVTIADNNPEGLRVDTGVEIKIRSSVLSNNTGGDCAGLAPDSLDYNIVSDGSCALIGGHDLLGVDPLLEPLAANGGMAPSHALGVGSPAIDSGVPDLCIATDQNGTPRPQGAWCDRGAHENIFSDLVITDITLVGADRIVCHYENQGAAVLPEGRDIWIDVILGPGELEVPPFTAANIGVGSSFSAGHVGSFTTAPISPVPTWPHLVTCRIDPANQIPELDETNNSMTLTLNPLTGPDASASGLVWHDLCAVPYSPPSTPPPGCVDLGGGSLGADGIYDPAEPGIEGLLVRIGTGPCPISLILTEVPTNSNGEFNFAYLFGGSSYCIEIDVSTPNDTVLIPGGWTYPVRDAVIAQVEISPSVGEDLEDIKFGWDYQFLPAPPGPYSYICTVDKNAFGREIPDIRSLKIFTALKGEPFEVFAKSEQTKPRWYFGKNEAGVEGWMSELVLKCKEIDPSQLPIREFIPFPDPTPTPVPCRKDMDEKSCEVSGGTWTQSKTTTAVIWYCECP